MTTTNYLVPLSNSPQRFNITLGGVTYGITCRYNSSDLGGWFIDIDDNNGNPLIHNIPLVTGSDLLSQYAYLNFYGSLVVYTQGPDQIPPTIDDLGTDSNLYFVTSDGD